MTCKSGSATEEEFDEDDQDNQENYERTQHVYRGKISIRDFATVYR